MSAVGRPLVVAPSPPPADGEAAGAAAPRLDVDAIVAALGADLEYPGPATPLVWKLRGRRPACVLALAERSGIPVALLGPRHVPKVVIAHNITTPRRRAFQRRTRWLQRVERVLVLAESQRRYIVDEAGLAPERVALLHDKVDHRFFAAASAPDDGYVLAVGREQRDYATLLEAARGLDARVVIVASSLWFGAAPAPADLPANVEMRSGLSFTELRSLYEGAAVVTVPLLAGVDYAAGVNALLEAMAMSRPAVVTETPGLADHVRSEAVVSVPPRDAGALRAEIEALLGDPGRRAELGRAGRALVEGGWNLDQYVANVLASVRAVL